MSITSSVGLRVSDAVAYLEALAQVAKPNYLAAVPAVSRDVADKLPYA